MLCPSPAPKVSDHLPPGSGTVAIRPMARCSRGSPDTNFGCTRPRWIPLELTCCSIRRVAITPPTGRRDCGPIRSVLEAIFLCNCPSMLPDSTAPAARVGAICMEAMKRTMVPSRERICRCGMNVPTSYRVMTRPHEQGRSYITPISMVMAGPNCQTACGSPT